MAYGIGAKLISNWKQNMLYTKSSHFYVEKDIYANMFQYASLVCKCVSSRPEHDAKQTRT